MADQKLNRQQRRKLMREKEKTDERQVKMIRQMSKPSSKMELYAVSQELNQRLDLMDGFLEEKFGSEWEDFLKRKLDVDDDVEVVTDAAS